MKLVRVVMVMVCSILPMMAVKADTVNTEVMALLAYDFPLGKEGAPITMIEYSSLSCPACGQFRRTVMPEIKKRFIDTGLMRFIHRDYVMNKAGFQAALLSMCKGGEHYHTFQHLLFEKQDSWAFQANYLEVLGTIAALGGIHKEGFEECLSNETHQNYMMEIRKKAYYDFGVTGVPALYINGVQYEGARSVEAIVAYCNALLAKQ